MLEAMEAAADLRVAALREDMYSLHVYADDPVPLRRDACVRVAERLIEKLTTRPFDAESYGEFGFL